jgi:hypothetical protein
VANWHLTFWFPQKMIHFLKQKSERYTTVKYVIVIILLHLQTDKCQTWNKTITVSICARLKKGASGTFHSQIRPLWTAESNFPTFLQQM